MRFNSWWNVKNKTSAIKWQWDPSHAYFVEAILVKWLFQDIVGRLFWKPLYIIEALWTRRLHFRISSNVTGDWKLGPVGQEAFPAHMFLERPYAIRIQRQVTRGYPLACCISRTLLSKFGQPPIFRSDIGVPTCLSMIGRGWKHTWFTPEPAFRLRAEMQTWMEENSRPAKRTGRYVNLGPTLTPRVAFY